MDFDEWEKMKEYEEGTSPDQDLYDAVKKGVDNQFGGLSPSDFAGKTFEEDW
jgi:hypothetical protein